VIGYEESSHLDVEPAKYFVLVTKREKRACRLCEELGVVSAPLPPRIIEKCLASDRIVIDTVVSKYCNHTPLHRQSVILERDIGLEISRATLDGWVLKVGELLIPLVACMRRELISGSYIQADETPVDVQHARAEVRTAKRISGNTVAPEEARCSISAWAADGMGQSGSWNSSKAFSKPTAMQYMPLVGLMLRRQFFEAVQLNPRDPDATPIVARMDELFSVDAGARRKALTTAARHVLRQETARPLLDDIRTRSRQHSRLHCPPAHSARLASTALEKAHPLLGVSRIGTKY
jgi:transposase